MDRLTLLEYRPGRYAWADGRGEVVRLATDAEADAELARVMGLETLPLFALPTSTGSNGDNGKGRPEPVPEPTPAEVEEPGPVTVATDQGELAPSEAKGTAPTSTGGNGRGPVAFVAYRDGDPDMVLASDAGAVALFPDRETAKQAAGCLGVAAAVSWARLPELARQYGLSMPGNGREVVSDD